MYGYVHVYIGVGTRPPTFTCPPCPHNNFARVTQDASCSYLATGTRSQTSSDGRPPSTKKPKQSKLTFGVAIQLDSLTPSTSHPIPVQEDTYDPDGENMCTSECCTRACDKQGPSPFQPKDSKTIKCTHRKQGQKSHLFSPAWYVTYPWITFCTTRAQVFCVYCHY